MQTIEGIFIGQNVWTDRASGEVISKGKIAVPKDDGRDTNTIVLKEFPQAHKLKLGQVVKVECEAKAWEFTDKATGNQKAGITYTWKAWHTGAGQNQAV